MIPPFFMPRATGRERGRHDRRRGRGRPSQRLSERLRQAHSVRGGSLLILSELTAAERRREARSGTWCSGKGRGSQRPSDCPISDRHRQTVTPTAKRATQARSEAHRGTQSAERNHSQHVGPGERWSGATDPSGAEALRSGSERVRQRLSGCPQSGRCCPRFWTVYGPVIHSRQLDASNRSS